MDSNIKLLLLKIIKFNGDISPLLKMGYDYAQVASLIQTEIKESNAHYVSGDLFLTEKGDNLIIKLEVNRKPGSEAWIEPELESKMTPIKKDFIYLPNKKDLEFLKIP